MSVQLNVPAVLLSSPLDTRLNGPQSQFDMAKEKICATAKNLTPAIEPIGKSPCSFSIPKR